MRLRSVILTPSGVIRCTGAAGVGGTCWVLPGWVLPDIPYLGRTLRLGLVWGSSGVRRWGWGGYRPPPPNRCQTPEDLARFLETGLLPTRSPEDLGSGGEASFPCQARR